MNLRIERATRASRIAGLAGLALLALAIALPAFAGRSLLQDLFFILTMLVLAQFLEPACGLRGASSRSDSRPSSGLVPMPSSAR